MSQELVLAADALRKELRGLEFPAPVAYTYNPLEYAWESHVCYLNKFGGGAKRVLLLGMNPGPWGMAQTGVPFGEVESAKRWLKIEGEIGQPDPEHPKRPIQGWGCQRSEVSGRRLWGVFEERFASPEAFFKEHFVSNYCPLVWMKDTGANLTPDKLPAKALEPVEKACQKHLEVVVACLQPEFLIGVGAYAEKKLAEIKERLGLKAKVGRVLHPSPASPAANRGWSEAATRQLRELGVWG